MHIPTKNDFYQLTQNNLIENSYNNWYAFKPTNKLNKITLTTN